MPSQALLELAQPGFERLDDFEDCINNLGPNVRNRRPRERFSKLILVELREASAE